MADSRVVAARSGTLITVAPTGAETAKADCPHLPDDAGRAGRRGEGLRGARAPRWSTCTSATPSTGRPWTRSGCATPSQALREQTDLIVQLSTGGSVHDPLEQRLKVLDAEPDSCSLTCGTTNFGNDVFLNPYPFMEQLYQQAQEREVVPEFELFDLGHVAAMRRLIDTYGLPYGGRVHVDFVTGVPGGMPGTTAALVAGVQALPPEVTSWSATGIGRTHLPIMAAALSHGRAPAGRHGGQPDLRPPGAGPGQRPAGRTRRRSHPNDAAAADVAPTRRVACWPSRNDGSPPDSRASRPDVQKDEVTA